MKEVNEKKVRHASFKELLVQIRLRTFNFIKRNVVMVIALILACVTCFIVPPDKE